MVSLNYDLNQIEGLFPSGILDIYGQYSLLSAMVRVITLYILLGLTILPERIPAQGNFKNVVIFFGDNEARPAYSRIISGIKSTFPEESATRINLISEYLNLERFSDSSHLRQVVNMYNSRVKVSSINLVVTVMPGAYDALRNLQRSWA